MCLPPEANRLSELVGLVKEVSTLSRPDEKEGAEPSLLARGGTRDKLLVVPEKTSRQKNLYNQSSMKY